MAEFSAIYTLTTPANDPVFNAASGDTYILTAIRGLDGAPIRAPVDDAPQTDGGIVHPFRLGPRHVTAEGFILIRSAATEAAFVTARNTLESALIAALEAIRNADGTLTWTPTGGAGKTLSTLRHDSPCEFSGAWIKTFVFGLVAANPTIT